MYKQKIYAHKGILNPRRFDSEVSLRCYEPSPALVPFVDVFFVARWHRPNQPTYKAADILSSPVVNIFFTQQGAYVNGITPGRREFIIDESGMYAGIKFKPGTFRAFVDYPLIKLVETTPLQDFFSEVTPEFTARLMAITNDQEVVGRMEELLTVRQLNLDPKITSAKRAMALLENGSVSSVKELSKALHMSERSVHYLFSEYVGVSVKWIGMRSRLLKALEHSLSEEIPRWTDIAAELNYSTQSHFINDFRRLLGVAPSEYIKILQSGTVSQNTPLGASHQDIKIK